MLEQKLSQIESMISDLILSVGTLKAYFEEEKEENRRRFEAIDRRFDEIDQRFEAIDRRFDEVDQRFEAIDRRFDEVDQRFIAVDKRFDEVMTELRSNKTEHDYMASRLFRAEMEIDSLKQQLAKNMT